MSTATLTPETRARTSAEAGVTIGRVIRSEWIKLRSLRSTAITLGAALVVVIGFGLLAASVVSGDGGGPGGGPIDPTDLSLSGVTLGQLILGVLGVLVIAGEYSTGMIRATLAAVPTRLPVLWAKVVVFGGVTLVVSLVATVAAFLAGQAALGADGVALGDDGTLRAVFGAAIYLTGIGLLGLALGAILRHTAGAIGALVGLILILPTMVGLLPDSWSEPLTKILPSNAGSAFMSADPASTLLSSGAGLAVFIAWIVGALAVAAVLMRRRDA
ncbi:ABC transporter permease subunit [Cryptosporangium aurantiacum]|uniref:ABC-type transport system involved in multi-copper enzyme maturation, permease component n=1 Tax=Cryptosporangium aurantiacum TaxID=134849 RepID=A0A1M7MMA9_9ACTN|nr:ABC transporter permease subunit [Cryptosporangium aurantiacum]SHM92100.1 ABC-type transport system involved in multi-copper enzyme maturation, permease component [Cryptosporangium aurantiacum]